MEDEVFPPKWSAFKGILSDAQHRKCAFCEGYAIGQGHGDVEHFCPKSRVDALDDADPSTWGREVEHLARVEGRRPIPVSDTGYWWLAYDWDNYVLACAICNQAWKRTIFPILGPRAKNYPSPKAKETPLLLHPFRGPHPKEHLEFGRLGEVATRAGSPYGHETIRTLGLDRPSLREQRMHLASKIHSKLDGLPGSSPTRQLELLRDIFDEGQEAMPFCGMVRCIVEQRSRWTWPALETLLRQRAAPGSAPL